MSRTSFCWIIAVTVTAVAVPGLSTTTDSGLAEAAQVAGLQDRLEKDLRARLPSHFAFIARVVSLTERDVLPLAVVNSTHLWARKKPYRKYQYFEAAMRVRAERLGVEL